MTETAPRVAAQRPLLAVMALFLAAIFVSSFLYRIQHGSLQVRLEQPRRSMPGESMPGGPMDAMTGGQEHGAMDGVGAMMQKLQQEPHNVQLLTGLAQRFLAAQDWEAAEVFLQRALVAEPSNADILALLGMTSFQQEKFEDAANYYSLAAGIDPEDHLSLFNLGMLYSHFLGQPEKAKDYLEQAAAKAPAGSEVAERVQQELQALEDN